MSYHNEPSPEQAPGYHRQGLRPDVSGRHPSPQQAAANYAVRIKKTINSLILKCLVDFPSLIFNIKALELRLLYFCRSKRFERIDKGLAIAYKNKSHSQRLDIRKKTIMQNNIDTLYHKRLRYLPEDRLLLETRDVEIVGIDYYNEIFKATNGGIITTAHYGTFLLSGLCLAHEQSKKQLGYFYNPSESNQYSDISDELISKINSSCLKIKNEKSGVLQALRLLRKGGVLCMMHDLLTREGNSIYVPFFGKFYAAMTGVAYFSIKSNVDIYPVYSYCKKTRKAVIEFVEPIRLNNYTGSEDERMYRITCELYKNMENQIRKSPEYWLFWDRFSDTITSVMDVPHSSEDIVRQLKRLEHYPGLPQEMRTVIETWKGRMAGVPDKCRPKSA